MTCRLFHCWPCRLTDTTAGSSGAIPASCGLSEGWSTHKRVAFYRSTHAYANTLWISKRPQKGLLLRSNILQQFPEPHLSAIFAATKGLGCSHEWLLSFIFVVPKHVNFFRILSSIQKRSVIQHTSNYPTIFWHILDDVLSFCFLDIAYNLFKFI